MSMSSYRAVANATVHCGTTALVRGVRVKLGSDGLHVVATAAERGEMVTLTDVEASGLGDGALSQQGKVSALAAAAVAVGDAAYSAAAGKFTNVSTNALYMGKWTQAASGDGVLGEVELGAVA